MSEAHGADIRYRLGGEVDLDALNGLFEQPWPAVADLERVLAHSLTYMCAYAGNELVGYVNVAWDGGVHAFLLDPNVKPSWRRRGIGTELVRRATEAAREAGCEWLHVDYDPELEPFYEACGFRATPAGLIRL